MLGMSLYQLMIKLLQPIDGIKQIKREQRSPTYESKGESNEQ